MNTSEFKLSIVIPTKGRAEYARWTVKSVLALSSEFEVIVADSGKDRTLEEILRQDGLLERIVYKKTEATNSVVDNFNEAIEGARGAYIICIGDDDLITDAVIDVVNCALHNEIDAVNFSFPLTYWWPDFVHRRRGTIDAGSITIEKFSGRWERRDTKDALARAMDNLGGGPMDMPRIYAGMVSRRVVTDAKERYGQLFGGVSPDIFSSTLLAAGCSKAYFLDFPVIIPGVSGASTSGQSSNGTHVGQLRDNSHIAPFKNLIWDDRVPEFYSVPTVWGFSMIKALEKLKLDHQANLMSMYFKCFVYHRSYRDQLVASYALLNRRSSVQDRLRGAAVAIVCEMRFALGAVARRLRQRLGGGEVGRLPGLNNSCEAREEAERFIQRSGHVPDQLSL